MDPHKSTMPRLPPRRPDAHKGDFGSALIVGGSRGMAGAVALAGMAALRGGAGLVRLAVPETVLDTVAGFEPSYMTVPLPADPAAESPPALDRIAELAEKAHYQMQHILPQRFDASPNGPKRPRSSPAVPGLGRSLGLDELVVRLYQEIAKPMVFDADALNALAAEPEVLAHPGGPRILTPHPGEFARLIGRKLEGDAAQRRRGSIGRPLRHRRRAQRPSHAGDRRPPPGASTPRATPAWPPAARATC